MSHKPDVAIVLPALVGGGVERVYLDLAKGMADRGIEVDMVLAKAEGPMMAHLDPRVRLIDLGLSPRKRLLRAYLPLRRYFREAKPRWAIPVWGYMDLVPLSAAWQEGVATLWVLHNTPDYMDELPGAKRSLGLWGARRALLEVFRREGTGQAKLGAVSRGVLQEWGRRFNLNLEDKEVYPNPLDLQRIRLLSKETPSHPWIERGYPFFVGIGRLARQKDFALLLEAFAKLAKAHPETRLLILGDGPEFDRLTRLRRTLNIEDQVQLLGFTTNPYTFLSKAQAMILTSVYEGLPTVVLEALSLGVPVLAAQGKGGISEALGNGSLGTLLPRSPEVIAKAMEKVLHGEITPPSREKVEVHLQRFRLENAVSAYLKGMSLM